MSETFRKYHRMVENENDVQFDFVREFFTDTGNLYQQWYEDENGDPYLPLPTGHRSVTVPTVTMISDYMIDSVGTIFQWYRLYKKDPIIDEPDFSYGPLSARAIALDGGPATIVGEVTRHGINDKNPPPAPKQMHVTINLSLTEYSDLLEMLQRARWATDDPVLAEAAAQLQATAKDMAHGSTLAEMPFAQTLSPPDGLAEALTGGCCAGQCCAGNCNDGGCENCKVN